MNWRAEETILVDELANSVRGPRRQGLFAVWLTLRVAESALTPYAIDPRAQRKRVASLKKRLSSVALAPPIRRAITAAYPRLESGEPSEVAAALEDLASPAEACLGSHPATVLRAVAQVAREGSEPSA